MNKQTFLRLALIMLYACFQQTVNAQDIVWQKTIGGSLDDRLDAIIKTPDGGCLLGGKSKSNISGNKTENCRGSFDYWIVKLNSSGTIQWQKTIGGSSEDHLTCMANVPGGGFILGGYSYSGISGEKTENTNGSADLWLVKTDSVGNIQWQNTIGGSEAELMNTIIPTNDEGFILGASSESGISGDKTTINKGTMDYWLVKINSTGNIQWQRTIGGNDSDYLNDVVPTIDGGYLLTGESYSDSTYDKSENNIGDRDYWVVKTDSSGNLVWENTIGGTSDDYANSIVKTSNGGFLICGTSSSLISGDKTESSGGFYDYWIVKLNSSGTIEWQNSIGGTNTDQLNTAFANLNGDLILAGNSFSDISRDKNEPHIGSNSDFWILKTDPLTNILWQNTIGANSFENLISVQQMDGMSYMLGGYTDSNIFGDKTENSFGFNDYWVVKISEAPLATITPSGNTTFCSGGSVTLNANTGAGLTYQWKKYGNPIAGATTSNYVATGSGSYRVVVTNASGNSASAAPVTVTVNPLPSASITATGSTAICPGSSVTLNANTGVGLNYQWRKYSNDISGATGATYAATGAGTYKVRVTNANGCSKNSNSIVVTSLAAPVATITATGSTTFCAGDSVKLAAASGAGNTYQWRKGSSILNGATGLNYYAKTTGNYKVTVTATNGCTKNSNVIAVNVPCRVGEFVEIPFDIYPNPSSGIFKVVNGEKENATLEIKDVTGKLIFTSQLFDQETEIDLTKFPAGIYIAFLITDSSTQMKKLIIR